MFAISLASLDRGFHFIFLLLFCVGALLCGTGILWRMKLLRALSYLLFAMVLVFEGGYYFKSWYTKGRFAEIKADVDWYLYSPRNKDNRLVKMKAPEESMLDSKEPLPKINGAYALYPIYAAMAEALYPKDFWTATDDWYNYLATSGSDAIYEELLEGKRDLIFALAPSKRQLEDAKAAGLEYDMTPFCREAFVFYVNVKNPVGNLTVEQIKGIYSGRITDWKEIGAPQSTKIIPFQRNEGSGSQTTLQKLMEDTPIMPPLKEDRRGGMGEIISDTANYRNYNAAIGFSFRYYTTELIGNNMIKLLSIDGVEPSVENIRNEKYPLIATVYMVSVRPRSVNTAKIVDFMLSAQGQELVEKTGYVPLLTAMPQAPLK